MTFLQTDFGQHSGATTLNSIGKYHRCLSKDAINYDNNITWFFFVSFDFVFRFFLIFIQPLPILLVFKWKKNRSAEALNIRPREGGITNSNNSNK